MPENMNSLETRKMPVNTPFSREVLSLNPPERKFRMKLITGS
ncbi:hypothetical protein OMAG_002172 [Candidatus Omnitrophus magneticus]|uniref:Uncharacterized protein n=1 Tax=Candidatus Omnitrophus magneticus TaxID=1609969 RepID=A0A0F0CR96_9BACT|nr:hypothetical protein OMAG_002172 [Candidatus Omnitrophus magneticus]